MARPQTTAPPEIVVTLRHMDQPGNVREFALKRLSKTIESLPNLREANVEVTYEHTRPVASRYIVQVTLNSAGLILRVEDRGPNALDAIDKVHDLLKRRIKDWKGRAYYERRRVGVAYREAREPEAARPSPAAAPEGIMRVKVHEIKPMLPDEAIGQMEMLGHDFFFFLNAETRRYSVVYRRKAGGYGMIEPAMAEPVHPARLDELVQVK